MFTHIHGMEKCNKSESVVACGYIDIHASCTHSSLLLSCAHVQCSAVQTSAGAAGDGGGGQMKPHASNPVQVNSSSVDKHLFPNVEQA